MDTRSGALRLRFLGVVMLFVAGLVAVGLPALGHDNPTDWETDGPDTDPQLVDNNPSCADFSDHAEFKIEPVESGTYEAGDSGVTITPSGELSSVTVHLRVRNTPAGQVLDYIIHGGVANEVVVKGGPDANLYDYNNTPGATPGPQAKDDGLHAPNRTENRYYGLSHVSFCIQETVTKSGTKFEDLDGDGVKDSGESGVSGWEIRAYADNDSSGDLTSGDTLAGSDTTGTDGSYRIELSPGEYVVCEVAQSGWTQSYPDNTVCENDAVDSALAPGGWAVNLTADDSGNDFGNFRNATKSGTKFKDADNDGTQDSGESGLQDWTIHLFGTDGLGNTVHMHDTTDADGDYSFSVPPGTYTVCETVESNWRQTHPESGADCSGHTDASDDGYSITLTSNHTDADNDFGNTPLSRVTVEFEDLTGFTQGSIDCPDAIGDASSATGTTNETISTESTTLPVGTYTCTVTIVDP